MRCAMYGANGSFSMGDSFFVAKKERVFIVTKLFARCLTGDWFIVIIAESDVTIGWIVGLRSI